MSVVSSAGAPLPELRDAHEASKIRVYLRELWDRRSYVAHTAMSELRHRQITNVLGNLWHLLNPALTIGIYYIIFGVLLDVRRGVEGGKFFLFLTAGLFIFQFTQKAVIDGAKAITSNRGVIRAVRFPRALLPISSTTTEFIAALPSFFVLFVIAVLSDELPQPRWVLIVPFVLLQLLFTAGASMVAARLSVHFADTRQILPFVFRLVLYASGVIFSVDGYVVDNPGVELLFTLNPMYCYISLARWTVMGGAFPWDLLLSAAVWAVAMFVVGFAWFRAGEDLYARD